MVILLWSHYVLPEGSSKAQHIPDGVGASHVSMCWQGILTSNICGFPFLQYCSQDNGTLRSSHPMRSGRVLPQPWLPAHYNIIPFYGTPVLLRSNSLSSSAKQKVYSTGLPISHRRPQVERGGVCFYINRSIGKTMLSAWICFLLDEMDVE